MGSIERELDLEVARTDEIRRGNKPFEARGCMLRIGQLDIRSGDVLQGVPVPVAAKEADTFDPAVLADRDPPP